MGSTEFLRIILARPQISRGIRLFSGRARLQAMNEGGTCAYLGHRSAFFRTRILRSRALTMGLSGRPLPFIARRARTIGPARMARHLTVHGRSKLWLDRIIAS